MTRPFTRDRRTPAADAAAGSSRQALWTIAVLTTTAAILVRLWFPRAWGELYAPASVFYEGDARAYLSYAAHLIQGLPFDNGVPFHPPGWPLVLSLFFRVAGFDPLDGPPVDHSAVKAFVAVLSGVTVGLTAVLAGRMWGRGASLGAAMMGIFSFPHIVAGSVPNAEALYGLLVVASMTLAWRWISRRSSPRLAATLAVVAALATLVRPEFALCAILFGFARLRSTTSDNHAEAWSHDLAAYALVFVLALTPTTIRHWQSISAFNETRAARLPGPLPRLAPITSYGAFNFANANHEHASGGFNFDSPALRPQTPEEEKQFDEGYLDLALPSVHRVYVHGYAIGLRWMAAHPAEALALFGRKLTITSDVFAHGYLQTNIGSSIDGVRKPVDLVAPSTRWLSPIHLGLACYGVWLVTRRKDASARPLRWMVFAPLASLAASSILFYGYVRLGAAYLPVFWLLQAPAIATMASRLPMPRVARSRTGLLILVLAVMLLAAEAIGVTNRHSVLVEGTTAPDGRLVQDATVTLRSR